MTRSRIDVTADAAEAAFNHWRMPVLLRPFSHIAVVTSKIRIGAARGPSSTTTCPRCTSQRRPPASFAEETARIEVGDPIDIATEHAEELRRPVVS